MRSRYGFVFYTWQWLKFTHIGLQDQVEAVNALVDPSGSETVEAEEGALQMRCISGVLERHDVSSNDTTRSSCHDLTPCEKRGLGTNRHGLAHRDKVERGVSNILGLSEEKLGVAEQVDAESDALQDEDRLQELVRRWPELSEATRKKIMKLTKPVSAK